MDYIVMPLFIPITVVALKWIYDFLAKQTKNKPPLVPGGIPFIGNVIGFDRKRPHLTLSKWSKQFGNIFRIKLFGEEIVVVNSADTIKETLFTKGPIIAGRPDIFRIQYGFHYSKDVIFGTLSPKWTELKKLVVNSLKKYGTGCENIEDIVKDEVINLCEVFSEYDEEDFDPSVDILTAVVNCLSASILGKRFARGDPQLKAYKMVTRLFSEACSPIDGIELDLFPWLRFFGNDVFEKLTLARDALDDWIDAEMEIAKNNFQHGYPKCIFDAFYQAHEDSLQGQQEYDFEISEEDVRSLFVDMLVSGTFTTAIALNAFCLFMASIQPLQEELRAQIRRAFRSGDYLDYNEREKVPLLEATIYEVLRYISHVPLCLPHFTMADTSLAGYHIPKNRKVLLNLWNLHHDENIWKDPWEFNPKRFLDEDGNLVPASHEVRRNLLPFSGGRRACPGETMSKQRIYLIAGSILQKFKLDFPENTDNQSSEISSVEKLAGYKYSESGQCYDPRYFDLGLILEPKPFKLKALQCHVESEELL